MRLKAVGLKGFKSFPDRTMLEFAPGVSVVVGPNGSGKSNVTDAVLWAMGEQSPLAVRGQSMQDVIFAGGHGRQAAKSAEVELIFDNSDGTLPVPSAEVSVLRKLDRNGEGEYRINGARARMTDVLELLSDGGLGKEGHSVIGQGRVEAIVTSKPRDRRLLIEEAAGLGKHRRRRRRAQLKLDRTRDNLDRALDVEREVRAHLKPLKRQAEAAEIHARLERQSLESRWALARDDLRLRSQQLEVAQQAAVEARGRRETLAAEASGIAKERAAAEEALTGRARRRDDLSSRVFAVRGASERIGERLSSSRNALETIEQRLASNELELAAAEKAGSAGPNEDQLARRAHLTSELERLDAELASERSGEMEGLETTATELRQRAVSAAAELQAAAAVAAAAKLKVQEAREALAKSENALREVSAEVSRAEGELSSLDQFLRNNGTAPSGASALVDSLNVESGLELAVSAALGGRVSAAVVEDLDSAASLLDAAGDDGGMALIAGGIAAQPGISPPGAKKLADAISGQGREVDLAKSLLSDAWLVDSLDDLPAGFCGVAVTRSGRAWTPSFGELRQAPIGGVSRLLKERNRRESLQEALDAVRQRQALAANAREEVERLVVTAAGEFELLETQRRSAVEASDRAAEEARRAEWLVETRTKAPQAGPVAVQRAEVAAELAAEERIAARLADEREGAAARMAATAERLRRDRDLRPAVAALIESLGKVAAALKPLEEKLQAELEADGTEGASVASRLRELAAAEAEVQAKMAALSESVTVSEVESQRLRDRRDEAAIETSELSSKLGLEDGPASEALPEEEREQLASRVERLAKRREQLGPVNPLAAEEYEAALEHLHELEEQRKDLEQAMAELAGLVRDCDRTIRETFEQTFAAASEHFEVLAEQLFPGGKGRLRLVEEDQSPKKVLGGAEVDGESAADTSDEEPVADDEPDGHALFGVEIEITPAGKTMKRLSLLSGGEKSMTALAFLFAVFLARPCPFYILDEVEAALDDLNLGRFLDLLRAHRDQAQFIVVTHQRRTMEAADALYGVSMGGDGVSKIISRKLDPELEQDLRQRTAA